jgi:antitoxin ParD1/3/4
MSQVEKVSIALTAELAATVRAAVATGEYASSSEVVREALRDWTQRRTLRQRETEILRELWEEGLASGPSEILDMNEIRQAVRDHRMQKAH